MFCSHALLRSARQMVAAPLSFESGSVSGPRPINLQKDIAQVLALLTLVFRPSLDADGQRRLNSMSLGQYPWPLLRLRQWWEGTVPGFVWEEDGRIVGNVSLLTTKHPERYVVANVAVHPEHRRQGIARLLLEAALDHVERQGGREILLQVKEKNEGAIRLYESLGFLTSGSITSWRSSYSRVVALPVPVSERSPDRFGGFLLRPLRSSEWQAAWQLDCASLHPGLNWPVPLARDAYRRSIFRRLDNLVNGRGVETWVAEDNSGAMVGLGTILSEWGRAHTLSLRVLPGWRGQVERPLLAKLLRRLRHLARREIRMEHDADDEVTNRLLREANFLPRLTLVVMRFDF